MPQQNLQESMASYSQSNGYVATEFKQATCTCGSTIFRVLMNEDEGVAARICMACGAEAGIADSDDFIDEVEDVYGMECTCGCDTFEVMVGLSLYENTEDVRWLYLGLKCTNCGLAGVYGDWKNEYIGYRELLDRV